MSEMEYGKSSEFTNTIFIRIIFTPPPHPPSPLKEKSRTKSMTWKVINQVDLTYGTVIKDIETSIQFI